MTSFYDISYMKIGFKYYEHMIFIQYGEYILHNSLNEGNMMSFCDDLLTKIIISLLQKNLLLN